MAGSKLEGRKEFERKLLEGVERLKQAVGAGIYLEGNNILADAKQNCPVAPANGGTLRQSHYCTMPVDTPKGMVCEIGCGGPAEEYAVIQHENTNFHHTHGEAKWLQNAFNRGMSGYRQNVNAIAKAAFKAGRSANRGSQPVTPWEKKQGTTRK